MSLLGYQHWLWGRLSTWYKTAFTNPCECDVNIVSGWRMGNPRLAETGILESQPDTKKCSDLIEKQICDQQTQNLRL